MAASTSFKKRVKAKILQIPGTKPSLYNNQLLISTGIPSLDAVLGGGVAVGTVLLIEEDLRARYAQLMLKYFCAEGIVSGHAVSVISADQDPHRLIQNLPAPVEDVPKVTGQTGVSQGAGETDDKMSIAWRYQNQPKVQPAPSAKFGHYYNLTKRMDAQELNSADEIKKRIEKGSFSTAIKSEKRNILRMAIFGLGSPLWGDSGGTHHENQGASLLRFVLALRDVLRTSFSVCLLTVPTHLFQDPALVKRTERLCDTVLRLESFAASEKKKNPALRDYTGLFHLVKMPCLNELVPRMPETLDLAFRLRRKKFTIEKLHLPPELTDTASREQDDPVPSLRPSLGCSSVGAGTSPLDF